MWLGHPQSLIVEHARLAEPIRIAVRVHRAAPVLLSRGFKAEMAGSEAAVLAEGANAHGRAFTRLDYSGHGGSGGALTDAALDSRLAEGVCQVWGEFRQLEHCPTIWDQFDGAKSVHPGRRGAMRDVVHRASAAT